MVIGRKFKGSAPNISPRGSAPAVSPTDSLGETSKASIRTVAFALLSRRDYTAHELRTKLTDRGYPAGEIDPLIGELTASRVLDDARVAGAHARTAMNLKGRGRYRVARELAARGISRDISDGLLADVDEASEAAALKRILLKKRFPAKPTRDDRRRMYQHLMRRGFSAEAIRKALGRDFEADQDE